MTRSVSSALWPVILSSAALLLLAVCTPASPPAADAPASPPAPEVLAIFDREQTVADVLPELIPEEVQDLESRLIGVTNSADVF